VLPDAEPDEADGADPELQPLSARPATTSTAVAARRNLLMVSPTP
jgi:hypothetical protein